MAQANATDTLTVRAQEIARDETAKLLESSPRSKALFERASRTLPMGVASSFQANDPYPLYLATGDGSRVWDVDGIERVDYHGGFGCNLVGHAHPLIVEAVDRAARTGTQFAVTTEATVEFAELLCGRYSLDSIRFVNSGTEATMDAIRVARAFTGRDVVCKIEGSYHGHHDTVMFSVVPNADVMGYDQPATTPMSSGIPKEMANWTAVVPFNDLAATEAMFAERGGEIACLIMEPVMMNIGIAVPEPGYLQGVKDLCREYGIILMFDEVKTGCAIAAGGATERYSVQPDMVCLAKSIAGGTPAAAFGGRGDIMSAIEHGAAQQGTYNGNPLVAHAGVATLRDILTPAAYAELARLGTRLASGVQKAIDEFDIPAHTVDLGAKGCVSFRKEPLRNYRDFVETNDALFEASFPFYLNRGVFMTPGNEEQWTISVQHSDADIDRFVDVFGQFCAALRA